MGKQKTERTFLVAAIAVLLASNGSGIVAVVATDDGTIVDNARPRSTLAAVEEERVVNSAFRSALRARRKSTLELQFQTQHVVTKPVVQTLESQQHQQHGMLIKASTTTATTTATTTTTATATTISTKKAIPISGISQTHTGADATKPIPISASPSSSAPAPRPTTGTNMNTNSNTNTNTEFRHPKSAKSYKSQKMKDYDYPEDAYFAMFDDEKLMMEHENPPPDPIPHDIGVPTAAAAIAFAIAIAILAIPRLDSGAERKPQTVATGRSRCGSRCGGGTERKPRTIAIDRSHSRRGTLRGCGAERKPGPIALGRSHSRCRTIVGNGAERKPGPIALGRALVGDAASDDGRFHTAILPVRTAIAIAIAIAIATIHTDRWHRNGDAPSPPPRPTLPPRTLSPTELSVVAGPP
eukprot:jgi/Psemu1/15687/gm1.15687_g